MLATEKVVSYINAVWCEAMDIQVKVDALAN